MDARQRSFVNVAVLSLLIAALSESAAPQDCTISPGGITRFDDHIFVAATAGTGDCLKVGAMSSVLVQWEDNSMNKEHNICDTPTCATNIADHSLSTLCVPPGTYTIHAWGSCNKENQQNQLCYAATTAYVPIQYTQEVRQPSASLLAQPHPLYSGGYEITAIYSFPFTSFTCRSLGLYDYKTNDLMGGFYLAESSGSAVQNEAHYPGCFGREVFAKGQAVTAAETVESSPISLPPIIASPPSPQTTCVLGRGSSDKQRKKPGSSDTCTGVPCAGDPINLGSGDVMAIIPLFSIDEPGGPLSLTLSYHSAPPLFRSLAGEMGLGWQHSFGQRLKNMDAAANHLYYVDREGVERLFLRSSETLWVPSRPAGGTDTVTLSGPGTEYLLKNAHETITFDRTSGRWMSTTDRWGNTTSAQYDGSGNLASVTDALGRVITITAVGTALQQLVLPGGATWQFSYTDNNLTTVYDPLHSSTPWRSFAYQLNSRGERRLLTSVKDEANAVLQAYTYDSQERGVTSVTGSGRDQITIQYNTPSAGKARVTHAIDGTHNQVADTTIAIKDSQYFATELSGTGCATCSVSGTQTRQYDDFGRVTSTTDAAGAVRTHTYDGNGNVLTTTEASGTALARTTTQSYADATWPTLWTTQTRPAAFGNTTTTRTWNATARTLTEAVTGKLTAAGSPVTFTTNEHV